MRSKYRHYGQIVESLIKEAVKLPEGDDKDTLTKLIANHMKKSYLTWNRDSVTDEIIFNDLYRNIRQKADRKGRIEAQRSERLSERKTATATTETHANAAT